MICRAQKLHPELEFYQADAHDLSFLQGSFDIIIFSTLLRLMGCATCF